MKPVQFSKPASDELTGAARWYETRRSGLGADFDDEIVRIIYGDRWLSTRWVRMAANSLILITLADGARQSGHQMNYRSVPSIGAPRCSMRMLRRTCIEGVPGS